MEEGFKMSVNPRGRVGTLQQQPLVRYLDSGPKYLKFLRLGAIKEPENEEVLAD